MFATLNKSGLRAPTASSRACVQPRVNRTARMVVRAEKENPYHDRKHTHKGNPGGTKDAGQTHKDKDDQYAYQQERLEWRRKNQGAGIEDRDEPPHRNENEHGYSAEKVGPQVKDNTKHASDSLADKNNPIGKVVRKLTGGE